MLEVVALTKKFKNLEAVKFVNLNINPGEICVLVGPNGAGKSTTIKCIAGLLRYEGTIKINGFYNKSKEGKKSFSYVPELPGLFPLLTVEEHIHFIARAYGVTDYMDYANRLFDIFDLSDKTDKLGSELSKGMQQKLSICCALVTKPKLILFDEPMIGLDPKAIKELKNLFLELKSEGCSLLISTHLLDSMEDLWDRIVIMNKGTVVLSKTKKELDNDGSTNLEKIFFEITEGAEE